MSLLNSVRADVVQALVDKLDNAASLEGVTILDGLDGKQITNETIIVANLKGVEGGIRDMRAGRKARTDKFDVTVILWAAQQGQTAAQARSRCVELLAALEDVLADDPSLGSVPGLYSAQLGPYDGPDAAPGTEGHVAQITATINCDSRLN